jgi:DNA-binding SARP family transcriptional activator
MDASSVAFGLLGPPQASVDGVELPLGAGKLRVLLALLAASGNQAVPADELVDALWDGQPPRTAAQNLRVYVYHLRRLLGDDSRVVWTAPGYRLVVRPDELDVDVFDRLVGTARAALPAEPALAAGLLREALACWRGPALAGLPDVPALRTVAARLQERRLAAIEDRAGADLMLGRHAELVSELGMLCAQQPYRENLSALLMLALYRCDRRAEAFAVYRAVREQLVTELGVEPGPRLRRLHQAMLADALPAEFRTRPEDRAEPEVAAHGGPELDRIRAAVRELDRRLDRLEAARQRSAG